jgi:hypothetical protein
VFVTEHDQVPKVQANRPVDAAAAVLTNPAIRSLAVAIALPSR